MADPGERLYILYQREVFPYNRNVPSWDRLLEAQQAMWKRIANNFIKGKV